MGHEDEMKEFTGIGDSVVQSLRQYSIVTPDDLRKAFRSNSQSRAIKKIAPRHRDQLRRELGIADESDSRNSATSSHCVIYSNPFVTFADSSVELFDGLIRARVTKKLPANMSDTCLKSGLELMRVPQTGAVVDGLKQYLAEREDDTRRVPTAYSKFREFGTEDNAIILGKYKDPDGVERQYYLVAEGVLTALRALNGEGSYITDDFTLHLCRPAPVLTDDRDDRGILIAPTFEEQHDGRLSFQSAHPEYFDTSTASE